MPLRLGPQHCFLQIAYALPFGTNPGRGNQTLAQRQGNPLQKMPIKVPEGFAVPRFTHAPQRKAERYVCHCQDGYTLCPLPLIPAVHIRCWFGASKSLSISLVCSERAAANAQLPRTRLRVAALCPRLSLLPGTAGLPLHVLSRGRRRKPVAIHLSLN